MRDEAFYRYADAIFPARLTAKTGTNPILYSWTEQTITTAGEYVDAPGGRVGTPADSAARELNNASVGTGAYVWLRTRGAANGLPVYEFMAGGGGTLTAVTNVCPITGSGSGAGGIRVEYTEFVGGTPVRVWCVDNPRNCCAVGSGSGSGSGSGPGAGGPTVTTPCCGSDPMPTTMHATITNAGAGGCGCASGTSITLVYNSGTSKWEGTAAFGTCGYSIAFKVWCDVFTMRYDYSFSNSCATAVVGRAFSSQVCNPVHFTGFIAGSTLTGCAGCNTEPEFPDGLNINVTS